jgi:predicted AAA+ superfamily ATPase
MIKIKSYLKQRGNTYLSFINKYANKYKTINKSKLEEFNDKEYTEELVKKVDNFLKSNKNKTRKTTRKKRINRKNPIKGGHTRNHKLKLFN